MLSFSPRTVAYCGLDEDLPLHEAALECFASGIMCDTCDFLLYKETLTCDGNCAECDQEAEGNCVPVIPAEGA